MVKWVQVSLFVVLLRDHLVWLAPAQMPAVLMVGYLDHISWLAFGLSEAALADLNTVFHAISEL